MLKIILKNKIPNDRTNLMFICIGTNENLADSIGPLIGSNLKKYLGDKKVLGDLENNIVDKNDIYKYSSIMKGKYLIAIDTAIENGITPGEVFINNKPIIMGKSLKINKGIVGDLGIKIILPSLNFKNEIFVKKLANSISKRILESL